MPIKFIILFINFKLQAKNDKISMNLKHDKVLILPVVSY
jgi:hypothetical protein